MTAVKDATGLPSTAPVQRNTVFIYTFLFATLIIVTRSRSDDVVANTYPVRLGLTIERQEATLLIHRPAASLIVPM